MFYPDLSDLGFFRPGWPSIARTAWLFIIRTAGLFITRTAGLFITRTAGLFITRTAEIIPVFVSPERGPVLGTISGLQAPGDLTVHRYHHMIAASIRSNSDEAFVSAIFIQGGPDNILKVDG